MSYLSQAITEMFKTSILAMGKPLEGKLVWTKPKKRGRAKKKADAGDDVAQGVEEMTMDETSQGGGSAETSRRSRRLAAAEDDGEEGDEGTTSSWNWESVLSKNPDRLVAKPSKAPVEKSLKEEAWEKRQKASLRQPTPAMRSIMNRMKKLEKEKEEMSSKDQLSEFNKQRAAELKLRFQEEIVPCHNTPEMQEVLDRQAIRLAGGEPPPIPSPARSPSPPTTPPASKPEQPEKASKVE